MLIERFQQLCKFIGTKETFRKGEKRLNSHKTGLEHQHGRKTLDSNDLPKPGSGVQRFYWKQGFGWIV